MFWRRFMGSVYVVSGVLHFAKTNFYMPMMPDALPAHRGLIWISGVAEAAGGLGLLVPQTRNRQPGRYAAAGLVLLLVAVFPANVTMITHHERFPRVPMWAAWLRLPLQIPLILWALPYTRKENWN